MTRNSANRAEGAVVFDYEETLGVENTKVWGGLYKSLGLDSEEGKSRYQKYEDGILSWEEFNSGRVNKFNNSPVMDIYSAKEFLSDFFQHHFQEKGLREESRELIESCRRKGFDTYLVSHAPDMYSKLAHRELGTDHHIDTQYFEIENGSVKDIVRTENFEKNKVVERLKNGYPGFNTYETVAFVGNGKNDKAAANTGDLGFMIPNLDYVDYSELDENVYIGEFDEVSSKLLETLEEVKT